MSAKYSTLTPTTPWSRSPRSTLPIVRWFCAVLVSVSAGAVVGCLDAPTKPLAGPVEVTAAEERLSQIARATAYAMNSADVRLDVLEAMRASPRVDHSLILGNYLLQPSAEELLDRSADALGMTGPEFLALVRGLGELEFLVPITRHRLTWTGSANVAVAAHWNSDVLDILVYEPWGEWLEVLEEEDWQALHGYQALFMVRPRETDGTRIGRQPDVPGAVIQDPGDGQRSVVLSWQVAGGEEVTFDVGQFGSSAEFHAAVAET